MTNLRGYRTFIVSAIAIAISAANFITQVAAGVGPIDKNASLAVIVSAIVMAALRAITTTAPGKSQ